MQAQKSEAIESLSWKYYQYAFQWLHGQYILKKLMVHTAKEIVNVSLRPAPIDEVINPGKGPFHFILLEVHLKSYWSLCVVCCIKSPWKGSSHGSQPCQECWSLESGSQGSPGCRLEVRTSPTWTSIRRHEKALWQNQGSVHKLSMGVLNMWWKFGTRLQLGGLPQSKLFCDKMVRLNSWQVLIDVSQFQDFL